jgi:DNA mismatch repair protein MutS2
MKMNSSASTGPELDLHRLTVDEALPRVDQFLYEAYVARISSVRIVHGKGTGVLRSAVRDYLPRHHLVKSFRRADKEEGSGGVTIVNLVDK